MEDLKHTMRDYLISTVRNYFKSQGKDASEEDIEEILKEIKNQNFKISLSNMSDRQLCQIANSNNLTTDIDQLGLIVKELNTRGYIETAKAIEKIIQSIDEEHQQKRLVQDTTQKQKDKTPDNTAETQLAKMPDIKINPTEDEIKENIKKLKSGESYTYFKVKEQESWGFGQNQTNITWTRNNDMTLTKMTPEFKIDGSFGVSTETYNENRTQLLSKTKLGTNGLYTTTKYSNSMPVKESTDLKDFINTDKILELLTPETRKYQNEKFKNNAIAMDNQTFVSKELINTKGETVITYKNNKFYNNNNDEITTTQTADIINKLIENKEISELIKYYRKGMIK